MQYPETRVRVECDTHKGEEEFKNILSEIKAKLRAERGLVRMFTSGY